MLSLPSRRLYGPLLIVVLSVLVFGLLTPQHAVISSGAEGSLDLHWQPGSAGAAGMATTPTATQSTTITPAEAFAHLQARATGSLDVHWHAQNGIPDFLAGSAPSVALPYTPSAAERGNPVAIARGFLDENRALFRLAGVAAELELGHMEPDRQRNYTHVRLNQVYHGIPVYGQQLIVHVDPREQVVAVNGQFMPGINVATQPLVTAARAEELALHDLLTTQLEPDERAHVVTNVLRSKTRLMVYLNDQTRPTLTWEVTIMTEKPLGQWKFFVHARRPFVVHRFSSLDNAKDRQTYTARNTTNLPGRLLIREGERSNDPIAQAAQDAAGKVYDYYATNFKRDAVDGQGGTMVSTVHYGDTAEDAENAAWVGELNQMIFGDGGQLFKPLVYGLDVVGHEFTHGVIDHSSQLEYEGQSGALNESYADVFGSLIEGKNWIVGEDVIKSPPFPLPYLRSLEDPNAQGTYDPNNPLQGVGQPANMDEYANLPLSRRSDNGGVHINSGIPSRAAFLINQALGSDKMQQIYYRTITQYLSPSSDFADAARATERAAQELYGAAEQNAVTQGFAGVGIGADQGQPTPPPQNPEVPQPQPGPETPPAPLPAGCTDVIVNGGFETNDAWREVTAAQTGIIDPELPHTGARSAWLGGIDEESLQYIYQDVRIPDNATSVELSYFRLVHEETQGGGLFGAGEATFTILIADTQGNATNQIEELSSTQGDDAWHQARFNLSSQAGKTIRLVFSAANANNNVSSMFVDDVTLASCTTGASPSGPTAPQTSSQDQVYLQGTITSADTGRGIEGAQVFVMRQGISATDAAADDQLTDNEVLTSGVTDGNGVYQSDAAVPRGQTYGVIIIARGYRPIISDSELAIPNDADNPFPVDATMRRGR